MSALGIDIGKTGAIAVIDDSGRATVFDIPTRIDGDRKGKRKGVEVRVPVERIDGAGLSHLLRQIAAPADVVHVFYENVAARPMGHKGGEAHGNGIQSQGSLMRSRGIVEGVLDCLTVANPGRFVVHKPIEPQSWKRHHDLLKTEKNAALPKARELFPECCSKLTLAKNIDRADALLIAKYGARFV